MLHDVVPYLSCPHCGQDLELAGETLRCTNHHSFDVARQGYVSLLPGDAHLGTADTAPMVEARARFLAAGHYAPLADAVSRIAQELILGTAGCIADVGAGIGYYLAHVLDQLPERVGLALDISKHAARRAARAHPRIGAVVCDAWRGLPVRSGSAALVINVFAPRNAAEIRRVLRADGALLVVTPTVRHLQELVASLGLLSVDERKAERLEEKLGTDFTLHRQQACEFKLRLTREDALALVRMGPSAWHQEAEILEAKLAGLPEPMEVSASMNLSLYRPW